MPYYYTTKLCKKKCKLCKNRKKCSKLVGDFIYIYTSTVYQNIQLWRTYNILSHFPFRTLLDFQNLDKIRTVFNKTTVKPWSDQPQPQDTDLRIQSEFMYLKQLCCAYIHIARRNGDDYICIAKTWEYYRKLLQPFSTFMTGRRVVKL